MGGEPRRAQRTQWATVTADDGEWERTKYGRRSTREDTMDDDAIAGAVPPRWFTDHEEADSATDNATASADIAG